LSKKLKEKIDVASGSIEDNIKLNLKEINEKINKLNKKLQNDDINYIRKNIKIPIIRKDIKIRFKKDNKEVDIKSLSNSISASSNHSDDAFILMKTILDLKKIKIKPLVVHDSIGSNIELSSIIKIIFKKNNIEFINRIIEKDEFPFDLLKKKFKDLS
jgi:hypothetical protein